MSGIVPFNFDDHQVRVHVDLEGNPWWVAADVCAVLDIGNTSMAVSRLDGADVSTAEVRSSGQLRSMATVNESGLYDLILDSRKPEARRFRRWVTSELIPAVRRTGSVPAIPQTYSEALRALAAEVEARELLDAKVAELKPAAEQFHRWQFSGDTVYVVEWAKSIGLQTQERGYEALRECGVLFKQRVDGGTGPAFNVPKRGYEQYFVMVDEYLPRPGKYVKVPKITAEGQVVLAELMLERGWISP